MEGKDVVAGSIRFKAVSEAGLNASAFITEGQRFDRRLNEIRDAATVFFCLPFYMSEGFTFALGLDHSEGFSIYKKKIVSFTVAGHREFTHGHAAAEFQVGVTAVLYFPPTRFQQTIYGLAGLIFRCEGHL